VNVRLMDLRVAAIALENGNVVVTPAVFEYLKIL
jgi:hypothetical protein